MVVNDYEVLMAPGRRGGRGIVVWDGGHLYTKRRIRPWLKEEEGNGTRAACPTSFTQPYSRVTGKHK